MEQKLIKKTNVRIGGFTLIEMVVVIGVIGVLMTLAFRGTATIQAGARDVKRVKTLNDTKALLEQYYAANGEYPDSNNVSCDPATNGQRSGTTGWPKAVDALVTSKIIEVNTDIQNDPSTSKQYCYSSSTDKQTYRLGAAMERKVPSDTVSDAATTTLLTKCGTTATYYCVKP